MSPSGLDPRFNWRKSLWLIAAHLGRVLGPGLLAALLVLLVDVGLFDGRAVLAFVDELARELHRLLEPSRLSSSNSPPVSTGP